MKEEFTPKDIAYQNISKNQIPDLLGISLRHQDIIRNSKNDKTYSFLDGTSYKDRMKEEQILLSKKEKQQKAEQAVSFFYFQESSALTQFTDSIYNDDTSLVNRIKKRLENTTIKNMRGL